MDERVGGGGGWNFWKNGDGVPIFPIKIGRVGKIGGVVFKNMGYHLFPY